ncbi:histidine decarboxylase [Actinoplanes sp. NPDC026619]|uniref:histidine decarboxylase n=1 Tax=Actinoplanes sp. NPDC026619 TaxID=3155798 RepID=UPI0033D3B0EC
MTTETALALVHTAPAALESGADLTADTLVPAITRRNEVAAFTNIGFPAARDIDYRLFAPLLGHLLNNVGDPQTDPLYPGNVNDLERDVLAFFADLFRAPPGWSGYLTSGGTEGNLYALRQARTLLPNAITYHSAAAHYSIPKALDLLRMPSAIVATTDTGEIDYADLHRHAARRRGRPAIVAANIGTTMTEAVDDVARIHAVLDDAGIFHRYVHSDAALSGIPLASASGRPAFDLADGADSISISGHKFPGTPLVCGVVITRRDVENPGSVVPYIASRDTTISGSRNGLAAAMLWYAIDKLGSAGFAERARAARELADYTLHTLESIGWPAWRNPNALTVMLRALPAPIAARWPLPTAGGWSHVICMPGVTRASVDALVAQLR